MTGYTYTHAYILGYEFSRAVEAGEATFQSFIHFLGIIDTLINVNNMLDDKFTSFWTAKGKNNITLYAIYS
jgi:Na+-transporting NADH:ubiquinone oxidoreductase subunit NqrE